MKAYCTKDNILVTEQILEVFKAVVLSIPFDTNVDKRLKNAYYRNIALFLQCHSQQKHKEKARFKGKTKGLP